MGLWCDHFFSDPLTVSNTHTLHVAHIFTHTDTHVCVRWYAHGCTCSTCSCPFRSHVYVLFSCSLTFSCTSTPAASCIHNYSCTCIFIRIHHDVFIFLFPFSMLPASCVSCHFLSLFTLHPSHVTFHFSPFTFHLSLLTSNTFYFHLAFFHLLRSSLFMVHISSFTLHASFFHFSLKLSFRFRLTFAVVSHLIAFSFLSICFFACQHWFYFLFPAEFTWTFTCTQLHVNTKTKTMTIAETITVTPNMTLQVISFEHRVDRIVTVVVPFVQCVLHKHTDALLSVCCVIHVHIRSRFCSHATHVRGDAMAFGPLLSAQVLLHSPRYCVWLTLLSLFGAGSFSFEFFHLSLDLSTDVISVITCVWLSVQPQRAE